MARMNVQKAQGKRLCAVVTPRQRFTKLENGEYGYVDQEIDLEDEGTFKKCGKAKRSHSAGVKNPITDHPYGGEDGTQIEIVMPKCGVCKKEIEKGEEYRYWAPRYGARHTRCMTCPAPSRSALTNSEILSMAWDIADEAVEVDGDEMDSFKSARDDYAERVQEIVDLIQEKMDNIEGGFGHTSVPVYEELEERLGMYEGWQQEIESVTFDDFETEGEACSECSLSLTDHPEDADHDWSADTEFDTEGALDALSEAVSNAPE